MSFMVCGFGSRSSPRSASEKLVLIIIIVTMTISEAGLGLLQHPRWSAL